MSHRVEGNQPIYVEITPVFGDTKPTYTQLSVMCDDVRSRLTEDGYEVTDVKADTGIASITTTNGDTFIAVRIQADIGPGGRPPPP